MGDNDFFLIKNFVTCFVTRYYLWYWNVISFDVYIFVEKFKVLFSLPTVDWFAITTLFKNINTQPKSQYIYIQQNSYLGLHM